MGKPDPSRAFHAEPKWDGLSLSPHGFLGPRQSLQQASVVRRPVLGEHLCPVALRSAELKTFCRTVCDLVCLNCNFGLWLDALAVCFTNSYLQSQIRLIKKPAPHGAINVTRTSREGVYEAGV